MPDKAWIVVYKSAAEETSYVVWPQEKHAYEAAAHWAAQKAQQEIEGLDWGEEGPPEEITATVTAFNEGKNKDAYDSWRDYADEYGPLDYDVEVVEASIGRSE